MDALNHLFTYSVINYWSQIIGNWGFGSKSFIPWPQGAHTFVYQWRVSWEQDLFCLNISQDDIFTAWIHFNRLALFCALWKRGQVVFITREVELLWKWGKAVYLVRKAMPKNAQTTAQLHSSHTLVKECSKFSKPGFSNMWTMNFLMFKLVLEKAEEPEIKLPTSAGSWKNKRVPEKHLFLLYWLCQSLWLCASQ